MTWKVPGGPRGYRRALPYVTRARASGKWTRRRRRARTLMNRLREHYGLVGRVR